MTLSQFAHTQASIALSAFFLTTLGRQGLLLALSGFINILASQRQKMEGGKRRVLLDYTTR